jgi:hypothetical protein
VPHRVFPGRIVDRADGGPQFRPEPPAEAGITVDRGAFDAALRGAAIFQPARIAALEHDGPS